MRCGPSASWPDALSEIGRSVAGMARPGERLIALRARGVYADEAWRDAEPFAIEFEAELDGETERTPPAVGVR